jgi:hypothetical protein
MNSKASPGVRVFRALGIFSAILVLVAGCTIDNETARNAINAVNKAFGAEYEVILAEKGTRTFKVKRAEAYDAIRVSLARLGMTVEAQDPALGFVSVYAPAPRPLSMEEWRRVADADLPRLREIVSPYVGALPAAFIQFEPEGLDIVITGTANEVAAGTAVSFTARMRETAPPRSGLPRREYLPPTAVRMGLDKMWNELEREFKATYRKP